jgi:putative membrane protein
MNSALAIIGSVFVGLAALLHVYIFVMESVQWTKPATWKRFGVKSQADADVTKPMALNQGFYNLFLALGVLTGLVLLASGAPQVGLGMIFLGAGSMVAAALVLVLSSPKLARAAAIQGTLPLIGIIFLTLALVTA